MSIRWSVVAVGATIACSQVGGPSGLPIQFVTGDRIVVQVIQTDDPPRTNAATITAARLNENDLAVDVRYPGGCRTHRFGAFNDGKQGLSNPPFVLVYLAHDSASDRCEAIATRTLHLDLTPLRAGLGSGTLLVRLVEPDGTPAALADVVYRF